MANATVPYRSTARPVIRPSADELDRYLSDHTVPQAAKRWHVNERTVRKWRARTDVPTAPEQPHTATSTLIPPKPAYATVSASVVADGDCMWKCPHCGDLHHPLPGTTGAAWATDGCYLCSTRRNTPIAAARTPAVGTALPGPSDDTMSSQDEGVSADPVALRADIPAPASINGPDLDQAFTASQCNETGNTVRTLDDDQATVWTPAPVIYRDRIVRERVVVRVPVERKSSGVLTWASDHLPPVQVVVAVLIALVLVGVASLG